MTSRSRLLFAASPFDEIVFLGYNIGLAFQ
jgi:hypothetical protein